MTKGMDMMNRNSAALSVAIAVVIVLAGCSSGGPNDNAVQAAVPAALQPSPTPAPAKAEFFEVSGPIVVENQLDLLNQYDGIVTTIRVDTGTVVRKGELLASLDDRELRATRDAADAKLKSIEADVKNWEAETDVARVDAQRAQKMFEADLITQEQLEHAKYKLVASQYEVDREWENARNSRETLKALDLQLEKMRIVAPFDGVVARRYIRAGERVAVGDRMFWVTATAPLRIRFSLPERFLGTLKKGQDLPLVATALPDEQFKAKVIQISPVVDPSSGTIDGLAEMVQPIGRLMPGMSATIRIPEPK